MRVVSATDIPGVRDGRALLAPNPTEGPCRLTFGSALPEEATVCVQDLQGKTLHSLRVPAGSLQCDIDLGGQPDGLYLVEITCNGQHRSYKLVKK